MILRSGKEKVVFYSFYALNPNLQANISFHVRFTKKMRLKTPKNAFLTIFENL